MQGVNQPLTFSASHVRWWLKSLQESMMGHLCFMSQTPNLCSVRWKIWSHIWSINSQVVGWKVKSSTSRLIYESRGEISLLICLLGAHAEIPPGPGWVSPVHQVNGHPLTRMGFVFLQEPKVQFQQMSSIWLWFKNKKNDCSCWGGFHRGPRNLTSGGLFCPIFRQKDQARKANSAWISSVPSHLLRPGSMKRF